jgi:hypothetical protein
VVELIGATTTKAGFKVESALDARTYHKGIKISKAQMKCLDIIGDPMELHHQPSPAVTVAVFRSRLTAMPPQAATTATDDGLAKARLFGGEFVDGQMVHAMAVH